MALRCLASRFLSHSVAHLRTVSHVISGLGRLYLRPVLDARSHVHKHSIAAIPLPALPQSVFQGLLVLLALRSPLRSLPATSTASVDTTHTSNAA